MDIWILNLDLGVSAVFTFSGILNPAAKMIPICHKHNSGSNEQKKQWYVFISWILLNNKYYNSQDELQSFLKL